MQDRRRRLRCQSRSALGWMLLFFLSGHLLAGWYLHHRHPEFFDPEFTFRMRQLPAQLAEVPGRPLALFVGSSRFLLGLQPAALDESPTEPRARPLAFNFALVGGGPISERLLMHRLLRKGIKPRWLFLEVWAPLLTQQSPIEVQRLDSGDVYWADVPILQRLYHRGWDATERVLTETLTPLLHYRDAVLGFYAPSLLPRWQNKLIAAGDDKHLQYQANDSGWVNLDLNACREKFELIRRQMKSVFDHFSLHAPSHQALLELLEECRANDIRVALVLMPEHSMVRGWYPPIQAQLLAYLKELSRRYQAPVLDTRDWQPDEDIPDCCHLSPRGAQAFSTRFGREIYRPLLQGRWDASKNRTRMSADETDLPTRSVSEGSPR